MSMKAEVINFDLTTKDGWNNYLTSRGEQIAKRAKRKELVFVENTIIVIQDPRTELPLKMPMGVMIVTVFQGNDDEVEHQKDQFAILSRSLGIAGRAIASVCFSEMWISEPVTVPIGAPLPPRVMPRKDPNRKEGLCMMSDHREFGQEMRTAIITPGRSHKRIIGPWGSMGTGDRTNERHLGRFSSCLVPEDQMNDPAVRWAAKAYLEMHQDIIQIIERKNPHASAS
jgi:hypothetical protein